MATLQEYMARRNMTQRSSVYGSPSSGSQGKYWWIREREDEDVLTAARRAGLYGSQLKQETAPAKSDAGFLEKTWETGVDVVGNILSGAAKSLEGIFDLGLGAIGAVGGIFDKGVRDEMRRLVEYDFTGENISKHFDRWSDDSIMNNSRAGRIAEGVFSGVGQLLPTVVISVATGGTALPGMVAVGAGAAGNATEEAFNDGADYYRGLGYGVVSGGVEMATEKLFGGLGGLMGGGWLDNVTRSVAKTGAARVAKEMVEEAAEEALAEVVNPLAKSIYKGRDALSDYGSADYWGGVGEAALVGGLTSAAYGGTVGRALKTSGKYADVQAVKEEIEAINQKRRNLFVNDKLTDVQEEVLQKSEVANYRALQQILQRSSDKKRADLIKRGNLSHAFDKSGTLRTDFLRSLGERVVDGETDTPDANGAQGAKSAAVDRRYMTPGLYYKQGKIGEDIAKINERRRSYADGANADEVRLFNGELSEQGKQNYKQAKRIFSSLSGKSGGKLQMAVLDSAAGTLGINMGDTVYISAATLEDGRYIKTMIEEVTHFAQGTEEHGRLARFLGENEDLLEEAESELLSEGNPYGFTEENVLDDSARAEEYNNELAAHMAAKLLDDKTYINRLVRQDSSLAEKIMGRLSDMGSAIARLTEKSAQQQYRRVKQASQMFEDAVTSAGWKYVNGRIEKEDEKEANFAMVTEPVTGQKFVAVERESLSKLLQYQGDSLAAKVRSYIKQFRGTVLPLGSTDKAYMRREAEGEYTNPAKVVQEQDYISKLNAASEFENLLASAKFLRHADDNGRHPDATRGWNYYEIQYVVPTSDSEIRAYSAEIQIKLIDRGDCFYDVTKIKDITAGTAGQALIQAAGSVYDVSNNSIAQKSEKSSDIGGFSLEKVDKDANQQAADDLETASGKQFVKKSLSDVTGELMRSVGMVRGKNELMSKLESLCRFIASPGEKSGEAIGERASEIADWMVSKGALDAGENRENAARTLAGEIYDQYWNVSEKISSQERLAIAKASARMDYKEKLDLLSADKRVLKEMVKALSSRVEQERKRAERAEAKAKSKDQDARESRKMVAEAQKKVSETNERTKLGERIGKKVGEIAAARQGKFMAASGYKSDILRTSVESLSQINYGKTVSGSVRGIIKKLAEWYSPENPLLVEEFEYDKDIAIQMEEIALGEENEQLSFGEMKMLDNIVGHMLYMEKHYQKIRKGDQMVDAMEYAKRYVENLKAAGEDVSGLVRVLLRGKYMRQFGDPLALVKAADAYNPGGFFTETYREFRQAAVDMAVREMELMEDWRSFHDKNRGFDKRMIKDTVEFRGQKMHLGEAISLYMTLQRKQAQRGLVESYYVTVDDKGNKVNVKGFESRPSGAEGKLTDSEIAAICKEQQAKLWESFDDVTRNYINMVESTFKEMRSIKQETDMEMQGYTVVSDKGYYYPIRRDQVAKEVKERKFEVDRVSHLSINRATVEGANAGLLIEPVEVVFRRHVKSISLYSCFSVPMENYNRLVNLDVGGNVKDPVSVKRLAENTGEMKAVLEYMDKLAKDIQGSADKGRGEQNLMRDAAEYLRGAYAKYQLGLNPKTVVTQLSSLFAASSRLDYASLMSGFSVDAKDVDKYCRLAEVRNTENSAALAAGVLETTGKVGDKLMFGIGKMDRFVIKRLYAACQVQVEKDQKLKIGSEANKIAAGELLQEVILDTQQNSLATERSDAMRSADTLWRSLTMFSADSMKVFGRFSESVGEVSVLERRLKNAKTDAEKKAITEQLKEARKNLRRSAGALVASSAFMALIAQAFRSLYAKDDDKEIEEIAGHVALDAMSNMVGGLPIINDSLSFIIDGYEVDNFIFAMYNDVLKAGAGAFDLASDAIGGKEIDSQQFVRTTRDTVYAVAQLFGIPVRNAYNMATGLTSRVSKKAKYAIDGAFYKHTYGSDLAAAIEADDEAMISLIASMMIEDKVGDVDAALSSGLLELVEKGHDVLPRVLGDSITYDGEETVLTKQQRKRFKAVYAVAQEQILSMMKLRQYKEASEEVRAKAIKMIWDVYWDLAVDDVLGVDSSEKNVLFAEAIDMDKLALIVATAREIKADYNGEGRAISGTRLAKIEAYVEKLNLKAAQKYMIMGYLGYKNKNGEEQVRSYINSLSKLSKAEKEKLMEYAGYANG